MRTEPCRVLFCDYDGEFTYAEILSKVGYLIDQVRPDALRQVTVGDHHLYIFSFQKDASMQTALKTCEKLKAAELTTPILLLNLSSPSPDFLNHQKSELAADGYLANPSSENVVLDCLDQMVGSPLPTVLRGSFQMPADDLELRTKIEQAQQKVNQYEGTIKELEKQLEEVQKNSSRSTEELGKALEAQRNFYKPKLKALLEDQKTKLQTETERLKFKLSEVEAKLLDREMRIKDLEAAKEKQKAKMEELVASHEKAQKALRDFYQQKMKTSKKSIKEKGESEENDHLT